MSDPGVCAGRLLLCVYPPSWRCESRPESYYATLRDVHKPLSLPLGPFPKSQAAGRRSHTPLPCPFASYSPCDQDVCAGGAPAAASTAAADARGLPREAAAATPPPSTAAKCSSRSFPSRSCGATAAARPPPADAGGVPGRRRPAARNSSPRGEQQRQRAGRGSAASRAHRAPAMLCARPWLLWGLCWGASEAGDHIQGRAGEAYQGGRGICDGGGGARRRRGAHRGHRH